MNPVPHSTYEYQVGGSLPPYSPYYVRRQADQDLYKELKMANFCYVLNSRQMGKSSLRVQTMQLLQAEEIACAAIDLTNIGSQNLSADQWYAGFVRSLVSSFKLSENFHLRSWWREHDHISPVQRLSEFIEEVLLVEIAQQIVIFIDEIDSVKSLNFSTDDFFSLIRNCYNQRADKPVYKRLTFTLLGVATPSDLIKDKKRTPFNIGQAIELNGFQEHEAEPLAKGLMGKVSHPPAVLKEILAWTGGQPFLTQKICKLILASDKWLSVEDVVRGRVIENWESQDEQAHLQTIRDRVLSNDRHIGRLLGLYQQILLRGEIAADDSPEQMQLRLSGLVVEQQGKLRVYNPIYQAIFNLSWVDKALHDLRPYGETMALWVASNCQDESLLLRGKVLQEAEKWAADKSLSSQDNQFLNASRELERRVVADALKPHNFKFKHEEASSVFDLIDLCDSYPDEAEDYLFDNESLETWLLSRGNAYLVNLSQKIVNDCQDERRKGLEMFVRGMCEHLGRDPYPKIFFEPNELNLGEIPVGFHKIFSLKIGNNGRGFAWGDVINPNLPGVSVPDTFDSWDETFNIELDTLEVQLGDYQGCILIRLEGIEYPYEIPINYKVRELKINVEPEELDLGVISHSKNSITTSFKISTESSEVRLKGTASTDMTQLKVTPPSFEDSSLELSLILDATSLEAGSYNAEISLKINSSEFQIPVYFCKSLRWDMITGLTTGISIPTGLCMYFVRLIVKNSLPVGSDVPWILSYPPEVVSRASFFPIIKILKRFEERHELHDIQLIYANFGCTVLAIIIFIIWLNYRSYFSNLRDIFGRKLSIIYHWVNGLIETFISGFIRNHSYMYYRRSRTKDFTFWLVQNIIKLLIFLSIIVFSINLLLYILAWVGSSFIIATDLTAYPLKTFHLKDPAIGWLVLGCLAGGTIGLIQALKYIEQYSYLSKVYSTTVVIVLTLFLIGYQTAKK